MVQDDIGIRAHLQIDREFHNHLICENGTVSTSQHRPMDEDISAKILAGDIAALSIDTSVFDGQGLALESGLFAQLAQFRDSDVELVIANTVANEIRRHLVHNATKATRELSSALHETARQRALDPVAQKSLEELAEAASAGDEARALQRFDDWAKRCGAQILSEEHADIVEVMRRYENAEPPFTADGKKKHEFPDAVALLTLEGWAERNFTRVLVVSKDKDWMRFGARSQRLVMVDDLAGALAALQRLAETRDPAVGLAAQLEAGDPLGLKAAVLEAAKSNVGSIDFLIEFDSQFHVEEDGLDSAVEEVELYTPADGGCSFDTVSHKETEAVIKVSGLATVSVDVHFHFEKWDGIDREYMEMGSTKLSREEQVEFEALVTVAIGADGLSIDDVEMLPIRHKMYFAELEPDWMSEPDEEAPYDPDEAGNPDGNTF